MLSVLLGCGFFLVELHSTAWEFALLGYLLFDHALLVFLRQRGFFFGRDGQLVSGHQQPLTQGVAIPERIRHLHARLADASEQTLEPHQRIVVGVSQRVDNEAAAKFILSRDVGYSYIRTDILFVLAGQA